MEDCLIEMIKNSNEVMERIMVIVWLVIIVVLNILGKWQANRYLQRNAVIKARLVATIVVILQCLCVYLFMRTLIPYIVEFLNIFYHH